MASGKPWTWDELLIAMNLYCKLPFGQLRHGNPLIIEVANKLGRTPSSLSMKLCNLASLDPYHQGRGIKGLQGASQADRKVWEAFAADWEGLGVASEERLQALLEEEALEGITTPVKLPKGQVPSLKIPASIPAGPTETILTSKTRLGQRFFRQSVLASYNVRCCITPPRSAQRSLLGADARRSF